MNKSLTCALAGATLAAVVAFPRSAHATTVVYQPTHFPDPYAQSCVNAYAYAGGVTTVNGEQFLSVTGFADGEDDYGEGCNGEADPANTIGIEGWVQYWSPTGWVDVASLGSSLNTVDVFGVYVAVLPGQSGALGTVNVPASQLRGTGWYRLEVYANGYQGYVGTEPWWAGGTLDSQAVYAVFN